MKTRRKILSKEFFPLKSLLLFGGLAVLTAGFVYLTVETATSGAVLSDLERKETLLTEENRELSETIAKASSLNILETKTTELGYNKPSNILYITGKEEVAKLP
jgi:hypothetical protein